MENESLHKKTPLLRNSKIVPMTRVWGFEYLMRKLAKNLHNIANLLRF
jgi:hypothetical protein